MTTTPVSGEALIALAETQLRDLLEPGALSPAWGSDSRDKAWESEIAASQAISLRRLADTLHRMFPEPKPPEPCEHGHAWMECDQCLPF